MIYCFYQEYTIPAEVVPITQYSSEDFLKISQLVSARSHPAEDRGTVREVLCQYTAAPVPDGRLSLPGAVTDLSRTVYSGGFTAESTGQNTYRLLYLYGGTVSFSHSGNPPVTVGPESLLVLQNSTLFSLKQTGNDPLDVLSIRCEGTLVLLLGKVLCQHGSVCLPLGRDGEEGMDAFVRMAVPLMEAPSLTNQLLLSNALSGLFTRLHLIRTMAAPTGEYPLWLVQVHEYIRERLDKPLTVGELAAVCGLPESRFFREFKRYTGSSPYQYITALRLKKAQHLLTATRFQIKTVAVAVGFPSVNHFSAHFRRAFGLLPEEYRRQTQAVSLSAYPFMSGHPAVK